MSEQPAPSELANGLITQPNGPAQPDSHHPLWVDDMQLVEALRTGNEAAFGWLVEQYHTALHRLALIYVSNRPPIAEELVQETWLGVLRGIHRFEGRSSLKTWIFRILINQAKKRGQREGRQIPFSALWQPESEPAEPAVDPGRFWPEDAPQWPGHWASAPSPWDEIPENRLLSQETQACLLQTIDALPSSQREVITLHDIEGCTSAEVCSLLGLSAANQRVLLHRARSKVREVLEHYFWS
jgi:RNA polymerase sigma-70 factor (ECF subfamily)